MGIWTREEVARRLKARFTKLKAETGMTQTEFAERYEFPGGPSMISQQANNHRPIGIEHAAIYAKGFNCSIAEINPSLEKGAETVAEGVTASKLAQAEFNSDAILKPKGKRLYPVITEEQARQVVERSRPYGLNDGYDVEEGDKSCSDWTFVLELRGDAMLPSFGPGDRFVIDPREMPKPGDCVAAADAQGGVTIREYRELYLDQRGEMIFELAPINKIHATIRSDLQPCTIIGVAVEVNKRLRPRKA